LTGKELCRLLENHGWQLLRIHGSHHVYGKPGHPARLSVPVHAGTELKLGLQRRLLALAGIDEPKAH